MGARYATRSVVVLSTDQGVTKVNPDGSENLILAGPVSSGAISPDGRRVFVLRESKEGERLHVVDMVYGTETVIPMPGFAKWMGFGPPPLLLSFDGERLYIEKMTDLGNDDHSCQVELFNVTELTSMGAIGLEDCSNILVGELAPRQLVTAQFTAASQYHIVLDFDLGKPRHRVEIPGIVTDPSGFRNEKASLVVRAGVVSDSSVIYVLSDWEGKVPGEAVVIQRDSKDMDVHPLDIPEGWAVTPSSLQISGDGRSLYLGVAPKERARAGEAYGLIVVDTATFLTRDFYQFRLPIRSLFQMEEDDQQLYGIGVRNLGRPVLVNFSLESRDEGSYKEMAIAHPAEIILGIVRQP